MKILIKEKDDMAKDKKEFLQNLLSKAINLGEKTYYCAKKLIKKSFEIAEKLLAKLDKFDPSGNLKKRVISGAVLIIVALYAIFYSKDLFVFIAIALTILMTKEWLDMTKNIANSQKWQLVGFFYILIPIYSTVKIRFYDADILFWMFSIIWTTDIAAYFVGKAFGGKKLAPDISPNKTWSGLAGGVAGSALIGIVSSLMFAGSAVFFVFVSILLSLIEQCSDLLESKFKRIFGVKDSGNLIPGHGGVLDRLDGLTLTAPAVLFLITVFSSQFGG